MKKTISVFLIVIIAISTLSVIPLYADPISMDTSEEEIISQPIEQIRKPLKDSYTREELYSILAGDHNFDMPENGIQINSINFPLEHDDSAVSPDDVYVPEDDYYLALISTGDLLCAPNDNIITKVGYTPDSDYLAWVFEEVSVGVYMIRNKDDQSRCLAAVPSSSGNSAVKILDYANRNSNYYWSVDAFNGGNAIQSEATGQYMYFSGSKFVLSSSYYTPIGLLDVDWWVPCTSLSLESYYSVPLGGLQHVEVKGASPFNANLLANNYVTYTTSNTSVCSITNSNYLSGNAIGSTTVTVQHKITKAKGTATVYVGYKTNLRIYYDNAFATMCEDLTEQGYHGFHPSTKIEEWFETVKKVYAKNFNIHLNLLSTTLFTSYPETLDSNGNMICANGDDPEVSCTCEGIVYL